MLTVGIRILVLTSLLYACTDGRKTKCESLIEKERDKYYKEKINDDVRIKEDLAHGSPDTSKCQYLKKKLGRTCDLSKMCSQTKSKPTKRRESLAVGRDTIFEGGRISNPASVVDLDLDKRSYYYYNDVNEHLEHMCTPRFDCSSASSDIYRRYDGSCNNLYQYGWEWGSADRIQSGYLWAHYEDGYGQPRPLPNPRLISKIVHTAMVPQEDDPTRSLFCMQFGQLLAHDMVLTEQFTPSDGTSLDCCGDDSSHAECFPIIVQADDNHFPAGECLHFVRSRARLNCVNNVREQVNEQTSFIDLSMVYGVSETQATSLRTLSGDFPVNIETTGRERTPMSQYLSLFDKKSSLKINDHIYIVSPTNSLQCTETQRCLLKTVLNKLPRGADELCDPSRTPDDTSYYCVDTGDPRANEQPGLASLHTIWTREHNRLASSLSIDHSTWDDETLYQEARKINIAQFQHIVYSEYLPVTIGQATMQAYNMHVHATGYKDTYNNFVDPTIRNAFGAAIFRFGHTLVPDKIALAQLHDETIINEDEMRFHFFEPDLYHSNSNNAADNILKWIADTPCLLSDRKLQASIQKFLFFDALNKSSDLATLNLQRGRDHGLPSYNEFRAYCNLPRAQHFGVWSDGFVDHEQDVANLLQSAYMYPDHVDLFTGYISERRISWSQLGPTGQCLFALQFQALRNGDRFFYERNDAQITFTQAQLLAIKQVRMSTVFCLNTASQSGKRVQLNMFLQEGSGNDFVDCSNVNGVDLSYWSSV